MFSFGWKDERGIHQMMYVDFWFEGERGIGVDVERGNLYGDNCCAQYRKHFTKRINVRAGENVADYVPAANQADLRESLGAFLAQAMELRESLCNPTPTEESTETYCYECGLPESENTGGLNTFETEHSSYELCDPCFRQAEIDEEEARNE